MVTMATQPTLVASGTPQQVAEVQTITRSWLIEAYNGNTGNVYISGSEATATSTTGHRLAPGEAIEYVRDNFEIIDVYTDLSDVWFDGDTAGNKLIVSYTEDQE